MSKAPITKMAGAARQLEAATYLMLKKFHPEPIHTLISAARGILYGLHSFKKNAVLESWDKKVIERIAPGAEREWRYYQNRVANFLKHADRDPEESIEDVDLEAVNEIDLLVCILAFLSVCQEASNRLWIGVFYCGLRGIKLINLDGIVRDAGGRVEQLGSGPIKLLAHVGSH